MSDRRRLTVETAQAKVDRLGDEVRTARTLKGRRAAQRAYERARDDLRKLQAGERLS